MRTLELSEYRTSVGISLSEDQISTISRVAPSISIAPSLIRPGCYDLTPGSVVGAISLPDLGIEIRPKIPIEQVLFLVSYALDPRRWHDIDYSFGTVDSFLEAIVPGFARHVGRALARGLLQGYRLEEDSLATVRGRIRFDDQLRDRFGRFPPVEVRFEEFTEDVEENRLLKAAIDQLSRLRIRSVKASRSLQSLAPAFESVHLVAYEPRRLPEILYTRLNEHYRPAVELARLVLRSTSFEFLHGRAVASSFLVDMSEVFESFVAIALRERLRIPERAFPRGARGHPLHLDRAKLIRLEPDLSWWDGPVCRFVGDVKYKRVQATGVLHPDLYQVLAYCIATDLANGLLIYAAGEAPQVRHEVVRIGKDLHVVTLDLGGSQESVLDQVAALAGRIRALYGSSPGAAGRAS